MATRPSGEYRLCCLAKQPESVFLDKNGKAMRLESTPLRDSRNSEVAKDVRKSMLKGEWHSTCKKCFDEESAGLRSRRNFYVEAEQDSGLFEKAISHTASDGSIQHEDFPLETFDIRIGNLCNLKCRMCGPIYSSKWYSDYQKLTGENYFSNGGAQVRFGTDDIDSFKWHENDFFWDEIFGAAKTIRHIYLIGGEPLIIKNQFLFLKRLVNEGYAQNIEIEYNTNLTVLPDGIIELWKQFKKVTLGVSLESTFEENDYIRNPSRFEDVVNNIRTVDAHTSPRLRLWITTTFQILNILSLPKMIDWIEASDFQFVKKFPKSPLVHLHPAHSPTYYNIQSLPLGVKEVAKASLELKCRDLDAKFNSTGYEGYKKTAKQLESVIKFMFLNDNPQGLRDFYKTTKKLDSLRQEKFSVTFPELAQLLKFDDFNVSDSQIHTSV